MRGFLGGLILGGITVLAVAASVSLMKPLMLSPDVATSPPETTGAGPEGGVSDGLNAVGRDADLVEAAPTVPSTEGTRPDDLESIDKTDTAPADKPSVGEATTDLAGPSHEPAGAQVSVQTDAPVAPVAIGAAPEEPENESQPQAISDQPVQPDVPAVSDTSSGFGSGPTATEPLPEVTTGTDAAVQTGAGTGPASEPGPGTVPTASTEPAAAPAVVTRPGGAQQPAATEEAGTVPGSDMPPATGTEAPSAPAPAPVAGTTPPAAGAPSTPGETGAPRIAALPQAGTGKAAVRHGIGTPARPLVGEDAQEEAQPEAAPAVPPIEAFAAPFDNPGDKPLMAIVLIDDADAIGAEALAEFPYPITFAVDPTSPDAAQKMARHRADGFEVVTLVNLAKNATAQDAETSLEVWMKAVPESVAALEGTRTGVQGNRALSDQVSEIMHRTGRGLILQNNGLNTAQKLAARAGVPSAVVFRDFDGAGQSPTVIRRFLDQAAFRARQEGAVVMLGRVRPDTISALLLWGLQDRADRVALAPVSAVLRAGQP